MLAKSHVFRLVTVNLHIVDGYPFKDSVEVFLEMVASKTEMMALHTRVSSVNDPSAAFRMPASISIMRIRKNSSPRTEPCGTPDTTLTGSDFHTLVPVL